MVVTYLRNLRALSAAIQVRAATTLIELAVRAVELEDISERVEALEAVLEQRERPYERRTA